MTISLSSNDRDILSKHDPGVRSRAFIELQIVNALIDAAGDAGYRLRVEGEERADTPDDLKRLLFNLDNAVLLVFAGGGKAIGWIRLVFGNDGFDLVSDYSTNLEAFLRPVNDLADFWGARLKPSR